MLRNYSSSDHSLRVKFLDSTLTWFPAHIEIGFCFLASWMECKIASVVFLLLCMQPYLRLFPRHTESFWLIIYVAFNLPWIRNVFLCVFFMILSSSFYFFIIEFRMVWIVVYSTASIQLNLFSFSVWSFLDYFSLRFSYLFCLPKTQNVS